MILFRKRCFFALGFTAALFFARPLFARQDLQLVTVIVNVPTNTPERDAIFLTGGPETGCNWVPNCLRFKVVDRPGRSLGLQFAVPRSIQALEFKITRGSWAREAAGANGQPLPNQVVQLNGTQTLHVLNVISWSDQKPLGITGQLILLKDVHSPQLNNKRDVYIWLPPSYKRSTSKRYPVLYMHDGQNVFDPKTSTFGVDWDVDTAMTHLARQGVGEAIVVGLESRSETRFDEYDYTRKGASYARFLIDTVKPLIDTKFRTLPGRESTFVSGSSMGALISVALVWKHPDVFSKAAGLSFPAFIHEEAIFKVIGSSPPPQQPIQIYIDHGNWGRDEGYKKYVVKFLEFALSRGARREQFTYAEFDYHDHTESDWARRVSIPLKWLFE